MSGKFEWTTLYNFDWLFISDYSRQIFPLYLFFFSMTWLFDSIHLMRVNLGQPHFQGFFGLYCWDLGAIFTVQCGSFSGSFTYVCQKGQSSFVISTTTMVGKQQSDQK